MKGVNLLILTRQIVMSTVRICRTFFPLSTVLSLFSDEPLLVGTLLIDTLLVFLFLLVLAWVSFISLLFGISLY
jgi:hypothetical protein